MLVAYKGSIYFLGCVYNNLKQYHVLSCIGGFLQESFSKTFLFCRCVYGVAVVHPFTPTYEYFSLLDNFCELLLYQQLSLLSFQVISCAFESQQYPFFSYHPYAKMFLSSITALKLICCSSVSLILNFEYLLQSSDSPTVEMEFLTSPVPLLHSN